METFLTYAVILFIVVGFFIWLWRTHFCSVCHKYHRRENELKKCEKCGKRFCANQITRYEKIIEHISGVLGVTTRTIDTRESNFWDHPCGFEYITTVHHGSSSSHFYCNNTHKSRRSIRRAVDGTVARSRLTQHTQPREILPYIQPRRDIKPHRYRPDTGRIVRTRRTDILPITRSSIRKLPKRILIVDKRKDKKWR